MSQTMPIDIITYCNCRVCFKLTSYRRIISAIMGLHPVELWGMLLRVSDYPRTPLVFQLLFPDETACTRHLARILVACAPEVGALTTELFEDAFAHTKSSGIKCACADWIGMLYS